MRDYSNKAGLWVCLWEMVSIMVIDTGKPSLEVGVVRPWVWVLGWIKEKMS